METGLTLFMPLYFGAKPWVGSNRAILAPMFVLGATAQGREKTSIALATAGQRGDAAPTLLWHDDGVDNMNHTVVAHDVGLNNVGTIHLDTIGGVDGDALSLNRFGFGQVHHVSGHDLA